MTDQVYAYNVGMDNLRVGDTIVYIVYSDWKSWEGFTVTAIVPSSTSPSGLVYVGTRANGTAASLVVPLHGDAIIISTVLRVPLTLTTTINAATVVSVAGVSMTLSAPTDLVVTYKNPAIT